jgi:hypothetical protein
LLAIVGRWQYATAFASDGVKASHLTEQKKTHKGITRKNIFGAKLSFSSSFSQFWRLLETLKTLPRLTLRLLLLRLSLRGFMAFGACTLDRNRSYVNSEGSN